MSHEEYSMKLTRNDMRALHGKLRIASTSTILVYINGQATALQEIKA